ncbi:MAG: ABC transporter ATP-binding protein [Alcanivoracaceae bacterium]|nr:ABC transporter ATP-binding protein [Alcanivoracaceae bacterium]
MQQNRQIKIASINNVSKKFQEKYALIDVSMDIYQGEVLSILGPNGAGKTTLINMMLGRLSLKEGEIAIFGLQPGVIELKRQCGAMLQVSGLPDMLTVKEHVQLFQSYYTTPMQYDKVIELAGLESIQNQYSKNLSGGQKQRLLFALSICGNPRLLFLDEPSVGMDINARKSLWRTITELKKQGTSIVLTTHYLQEADQLSDRIIMLNQGRIIHQGTPNEIKSSINSRKISFISSASIDQFVNLQSDNTIECSGKYYEIQSTDTVQTLKQIFAITDDISDLSVTRAALEDAFLLLNKESEQ